MAKRKANVAGSGRVRVTDEGFVQAWVSNGTRAEVAECLGIGYGAVCARAKKLRAAGVKLVKDRAVQGPRVIDVKGLNAIIAGK